MYNKDWAEQLCHKLNHDIFTKSDNNCIAVEYILSVLLVGPLSRLTAKNTKKLPSESSRLWTPRYITKGPAWGEDNIY